MRTISINTVNNTKIANLLNYIRVQLSDGYFEDKDDFYTEYWSFLDFVVKKDSLIIKIRKNSYPGKLRNIFDDLTDAGVVHYIADVLEDIHTGYDFLLRKYDDIIDYTLKTLYDYGKDMPNKKGYKIISIEVPDDSI